MISVKNNGLIKACMEGKFNKVKMLLKMGANINYENKIGQSALTIAINTKNNELINFLIEQKNINLNVYEGTFSALYYVCIYNKDVDLLIKMAGLGADINMFYDNKGNRRSSVLHSACSLDNNGNYYEIIKALVDLGANIQAKDLFGNCIISSNPGTIGDNVISFLRDKEFFDNMNETELLKLKSDVDTSDRLSILIDPSELNKENKYTSLTRLMRAIVNKNDDFYEALLEMGADEFRLNSNGESARQLLLETPSLNLTQKMKSRKENIILQDTLVTDFDINMGL